MTFLKTLIFPTLYKYNEGSGDCVALDQESGHLVSNPCSVTNELCDLQ